MAAKLDPTHYLALPRTGRGKGILVIHAWWGLNAFFCGVCNRLAAAGYVALAPDVFGGHVATTVQDARKLRAKPKKEPTYKTLIAALTVLRSHEAVTGEGIGVLGFSMGGHWALWLAARPELPISAAVTFYGARAGDYTHSHAAFQGHYAEADDWVSAASINKLRKCLADAQRPAEFFTYPGTGHWFFERDREDAYHAQAAMLAWRRTLAFLKVQM